MVQRKLPLGRKYRLIDENKRKTIFNNLGNAKVEIEKKYHKPSYAVDLGNALIEGKIYGIWKLLNNISVTKEDVFRKLSREDRLRLLSILHKTSLEDICPLISREQSTSLEMSYEKKRREVMEKIEEVLPKDSESYSLISKALAYVPSLLYRSAKESRLGAKIAWIGRDAPNTSPGKIVLVLSGGSAKGIVYNGFLKAVEEAGIYPDFIVGASAGALAGASFATGRKVESVGKILSGKNLKKIFTPLQAPITLFASGFSGILGIGFPKYLKRVFGERDIDEYKDVFIITTVQEPAGFGKTVIGVGSTHNKEVSLSKNIEMWKAVLGSCAIQGVVPPAKITYPFRAKRTVKGQFGVKVISHDLPYAYFDDGSVVESLPLETATHLLEMMNADGLLIAVNLTNINPNRYPKVEHYSLKEHIKREKSRIPLWGKVKAGFKWALQEARKAFRTIAPMRAIEGFEQMYAQTTVKAIRALQGQRDIILVNLNYDGKLSELTLTNINKRYAETVEYGYIVGKELCDILLGK